MAVRDILLTLTTYPEPTPVSAIEPAVSLAALLGARIAAIACETHVQLPGSFLSFGQVGAIAAGEAHRSGQTARELLSAFEAAASRAGVANETILSRCAATQVPERFAEYARLRDLTLLPVPDALDQWAAETVIFGSGRPTLLLPERRTPNTLVLQTALVAWDFSRAAARAVADAMPLLEKAREVRVLIVTNEKSLRTTQSSEELAKNLARHAMDVIVDEVDAAGRSIGEVLRAQAAACRADLLVMGAYGHSRFREFILGGATRSILTKPPIPVLFSH